MNAELEYYNNILNEYYKCFPIDAHEFIHSKHAADEILFILSKVKVLRANHDIVKWFNKYKWLTKVLCEN
jgi:hypothetical protein